DCSGSTALLRCVSRIRFDLDMRDKNDLKKENTMTQTNATQQLKEQASDKSAIRPFQVNVPEAELVELRRRITATQFPEKEPVADMSQGVPLATVEKLARYWANV